MWRVVGICALGMAIAAWVAPRMTNSRGGTLALTIAPTRLAADGYSSASLVALAGSSPVAASFEIVQGERLARIEGARLIAGVMGGRVVVEARARGFAAARAVVETIAQAPDAVLQLDDEADRLAFTGWFTFLAEAQYFARDLPREINDCAALIRFAYREALREHDGRWAGDLKLPAVPAIPGVRKYAYPFTPLGAKLFRTGDGFAEFADAETLVRYNTRFVSRDIGRAGPGDLLFFRQQGQSSPYHTMIFLGHSQFEPDAADLVVYHTGPFDGGPGEIRRPSVAEILHHPSPQWRPTIGNPNFVGVYRWNILRGSS